MQLNRRAAFSITAAGLIHISAKAPAVNAFAQAQDHSSQLLIREAADRGHTDLGWLQSYHSFSFGRYYDQRHMGFRALKVINDDKISAGRGFPTHPHRNMEILSYVLDGALQHKDSTGSGAIVTPETVQLMSAGTGITHSEFNPSQRESNHFLQIWIEPALRGVRPRYHDQKLSLPQRRNLWKKIVSPSGDKESVPIQQDATIFATQLDATKELGYIVEKGRHVWIQVARGSLLINGTQLEPGDAIATSRPGHLHVTATQSADALLFDLG